jgi:16S rRNA processing protein RimM
MLNSDTLPEEWVAVGRLSHTQGNQGELFGEILTDFPDRFNELHSISVFLFGKRVENVATENIRTHKEGMVFKFSGVHTISEAEKLVGSLLVIAKENLIRLAPGQYYHFELAGCRAVDGNGATIGEIIRVDDFGGNQLLAIHNAKGQEFWVPLAKEFIRSIDCRLRLVTLEIPEELMHLNP